MKPVTIGLVLLALLAPLAVGAQAPTGAMYTVEAGDWLSTIAARLLGDAMRYPEIVEATNQRAGAVGDVDAIADADLIEIGQRLWVPSSALSEVAEAPSTAQAAGLAWAYKGFAPSAGCCGRDITLYLYPENEAHLETDFLNGEPPVVADGQWRRDGQTVTVRLTAQDKEAYAEPETLHLTVDGDHLLPDDATLPDFISFPAMAWERLAPPYAGAEVQARLVAGEYAGLYKDFAPSASCCGQDITLSLDADGGARLVTDYMNGEDVLTEVGAWQADADGVTVTLAGMEGRAPYETPASLRLLPQEGVLLSLQTVPEAIGHRFYAIDGLASAG